jgi:hypothetical protein
MAPNIFVYVYYNGQIVRNNDMGIYFQSDKTKQFKVRRISSFAKLKDIIGKKKHHLGIEVYDIIYGNPMFFGNGIIQWS